ncbi:type IV pilus assembly protein PilM [bacterium]|nr:type IV pilus assembly protein PilM [bacterium]
MFENFVKMKTWLGKDVTGKAVIGLDAGTKSIKMVQLEKKRDIFEIKKIISEIRSNTDLEVTRSEAMKRLASKSKLKGASTVSTLSSRDVIEKFIKLHSSSLRRINDLMKWEVRKHITFPADEAVYDYNVHKMENSDEIWVHLAITRREIIENQIMLIMEAGFKPWVIEPQSRAIQRLFLNSVQPEEEFFVAVNIGSSSSTLIVMNKGELRMAREMDIKGDDIDNSIKNMFQFTKEDGEVAKREVGFSMAIMNGAEVDPDSDEYIIYSAIESQIDSLVSEIRQSLQFYLVQYEKDDSPEKLYITGGNAQIPNLVPFLEKKLGISVGIIDPLKYLNANKTRGEDEIGSGEEFSVACGLAMKGK